MTPAHRRALCVVDASVVAGAFFPDKHADACRSLLSSGRELHAPDLVYAETANVIWKRRRRGEIDEQEAAGLLTDILRLPLRTTASGSLVETALALALRTDRTVYDCLYLALALQEEAVMVSCDKRLANALSGGIDLGNRHTFRMVDDLVDEYLLVDEDEIREAMAFAATEHRLVVEGGGAVGIAALLSGKFKGPGENVAVVVSGGNVEASVLAEIVTERSMPSS